MVDFGDCVGDVKKTIKRMKEIQKIFAKHGGVMNEDRTRLSITAMGFGPDDVATIMHAVHGTPQPGKN